MSQAKGLIGRRLRALRGPRNQRQFAEKVAVSQQGLSRYEQGNIPASWLFLARLHDDEGVDLNELLTRNGA